MKKLLAITFLVGFVRCSYAQENTILDLNGPSSVTVGATKWYWIDDSSIPPFSLFYTTGGGTIISTNTSGSLREVQVQWTSSGSIRLGKLSTVYAQKNVSVSQPPTPPDPNTGINIDYDCGSSTITRTSSPPSGVTWYWQDTESGTSTQPIRAFNSWTIGSQKHVYLRAYKSSSGYWSTGSLDVGSVPVNPVPGSASGSNQSRCDSGSITLSATPGTNANSINWYSSTSDQTPDHTGTNFTPTISSSQIFYAASLNTNTGCESTTRIPITATIVELSNAGTLTGANEEFAIATGSVSLGGNVVGDIVKWQYKTTGGWIDIAETDNPLPYTNIQEPTYYRAIVQNGICDPVPSNPVLINILPEISMDLGDFENLRPGQQTTLTVDGGYSSYQWFRGNDIIPQESTNQLIVDEPGSYSVEVSSSGGGETTGTAVVGNQLKLNENSVITYTYRIPSTNSNFFQFDNNELSVSAQLYDGLGRPIQTVGMNGSPDKLDVVAPREYDKFGKSPKSYLPYIESDLTTVFKENALNSNYSQSRHYDFYSNHPDHPSTKAYAETRYESSPLNRPLEHGAPGDSWQIGNHTKSTSYEYVGAYEVLYLTKENLMVVDSLFTDPPSGSYHYNAGDLFKTVQMDEDGNKTTEYKNKLGQVVLRKSQLDANTWLETYYIYDIYGNLSAVLPPDAVSRMSTEFFEQSEQRKKDFLNTWAFLYSYDGRNRMIMKKVPGADSVFMVYDKWDRLVLTQDGNQRANSEWLFTKYDALNRPILTGKMKSQRSTTGMRNLVSSQTVRFDTFNTSATLQYAGLSFPTDSISEYLSVTYYDSYEFDDHLSWNTLGLEFNDTENRLTQNTVVKGLVTGSMTKVGDGSWIHSVNYYDDKYRTIQSRSTNHLGGTDAVTNYHDFIGQVNRTITTHSSSDTTYSITRSFKYDHAGRLLSSYHKMASATDSTLIAENIYNELGELVEKYLHDGEQSLYYNYNIRGWLRSMNNDLFGMDLHYDTNPLDGSNVRYNGNISAMEWTDWDAGGTGTTERGYNFGYDKLNRLTEANHYENGSLTNRFGVQGLDYDLNGNIKSLIRNGEAGVGIDSLQFDYATDYTSGKGGNRLRYVQDTSMDSLGFHDGNTSGDDYTYDANGNMTKDRNKGIDSIYYNHLNLPIKVEFETSGDSITYLYDAAGIKLNQVVYKGGDTLKVTDYVGEFIYETDSTGERKLQLIQHEEGRIVPLEGDTGGDWDYQYHLKDHLGNVRVTFSTEPENYTMVETFETGEENGWQDLHRHTSTDANTTPGGDEVELLQSGQTGAMIFLSVNKRDTINLSVQANYESAPSGNNFLGTAYNTLFTSFDNVYGSGVPEGGGVSSSSTVFDDALNGGAMAGKDDSNTAPRAFLNYIFFDKDMNYLNAGFTQISTAAQGVGVHDSVTLDIPVFEQDGYVLAYLSNENQEQVNVHFDDFTVYHGKTNVVSTQDYYPFGLTFNESVRVASVKNRMNTFQDQEYEEETGWVKFKWRNHQPDIGRFFNVDPLAESYVHNSPYAFSENKVINHIELEGLEGLHYMEKLNNGGQRHVIEKNVVVLVQAPQAIPEGASENKAARITRRNERTAAANQAKVDAVASELNSYFNGSDGQATNSAGEPVRFQFNVSGMEVEDTGGSGTAIADSNGLTSSEKNVLTGDNYEVPAAVIKTGSPSGEGVTSPNNREITVKNDAQAGAYAHEVGHALMTRYGKNAEHTNSGLMQKGATSLGGVTSKTVDRIIEDSFERD